MCVNFQTTDEKNKYWLLQHCQGKNIDDDMLGGDIKEQLQNLPREDGIFELKHLLFWQLGMKEISSKERKKLMHW